MRLIEKWLLRCEAILLYAAVIATGGMMLLTTVDAGSRYLLNSPIIGAYEITEKYLMVAAMFLGLSYSYRGGVFIRVTFLVDRLPATQKLIANYFAQIVSLLYCVVFVVATTQQALRAMSEATTLSTLPIPVGPAYVLVPIGFVGLTLLMLADLPKVRTGRSRLFSEEAPTA